MPSADPHGASLGGDDPRSCTRCIKPLLYSGSLDSYAHRDLTPVIGREYDNLQVADLLKASDSGRLIKDLAVTGKLSPNSPWLALTSFLVSERGVVVLRDQHVNPTQMRDLIEQLSFLAGSVCHSPLQKIISTSADHRFPCSPNHQDCTSIP